MTLAEDPSYNGQPLQMADVIYPDWPPPLEAEPDAQPTRPVKVDPFAKAWTADRLMAETFEPPRWAVPGLIPEGLSLLAGAPKAGKSWLSLNLALGIAAGTPVLGEVAVDPGEVLYLALEDTPRRLQSRMGKILGDAPAGPASRCSPNSPRSPRAESRRSAGGSTIGPMRAWSSSTCSPKYAATARPA